jgi:hypothetical protein
MIPSNREMSGFSISIFEFQIRWFVLLAVICVACWADLTEFLDIESPSGRITVRFGFETDLVELSRKTVIDARLGTVDSASVLILLCLPSSSLNCAFLSAGGEGCSTQECVAAVLEEAMKAKLGGRAFTVVEKVRFSSITDRAAALNGDYEYQERIS